MRRLNVFILDLLQKYLVGAVKIFGLFPFVFNHQQKRFEFPSGVQLIYFIAFVTFQIIATLIVMWLKLYRATLLNAAVSQGLAQLMYLFTITSYQMWILLIIWKLWTHPVQYRRLYNDLYDIYQRLVDIGFDVLLKPIDHKFDIVIGCTFMFDALFTTAGNIFYIGTLYQDGLLDGLGIIEAFTIVSISYPITFGLLLFSAGHLILAHFLCIIRLEIGQTLNRIKRERKGKFEFNQICLDVSDRITQLIEIESLIFTTAKKAQGFFGLPLMMGLLNIFLGIVSNVRKFFMLNNISKSVSLSIILGAQTVSVFVLLLLQSGKVSLYFR